MAEKIKLLIVEDEAPTRDALIRAFQENTAYDFQVKSAISPEDCIEKGFDQEEFDVYLVDLELLRGEQPFFGHSFIGIRAFEVPKSLTVVYSCHSHVETVTRAVRHGAADFIVKGDCYPQKVPERIARLLDERQQETRQYQQITDLQAKNRDLWQKEYAGRVIALVDEAIVVAETSRLHTLVAYKALREENPEWPDEPVLIQIPHPDEVTE